MPRYNRKLDWKTLAKHLNIHNLAQPIDEHAHSWRKNKIALIHSEPSGSEQKFSFLDIHLLSNKFANMLEKQGAQKGDRIFFFLPRIPELYYSFLGTLKTGAIAGVLFSAFGRAALLDRLTDSEASVLVTNKELFSRIKPILRKTKLKKIFIVDAKLKGCVNFQSELELAPDTYNTKKMKPSDPAYMLYTSGTTGKPKGIIHTHGDIIQQYITTRWVLDIKDSDIYWCTADPGWVTGIVYGITGIWANAATSLVYAGRFDPNMWYSLIDKYKVTVWYTAPTAVRMLMASHAHKKYELSSLRHLCSVGEPLNPEAVIWSKKTFGKPFHDTWWQTETGAIMIANYPCMPIKPGSMGKPFPGIKAEIIDDKGKKLRPGQTGNLAIKPKWPSMFKTVWKNRKKYNAYFKNDFYITGDLALKDKDGYFWFVGRADDIIKTSGERIGPFEVESVLLEHPAVSEAAVIGKSDPLRGQIIKAFIVAKRKIPEKQLQLFVKKHLAGHAYPREIEYVKTLPKTRSGKIVRRLLKAREEGLPIGDTSTIEK
jgi:acetyl-CoA synthetase